MLNLGDSAPLINIRGDRRTSDYQLYNKSKLNHFMFLIYLEELVSPTYAPDEQSLRGEFQRREDSFLSRTERSLGNPTRSRSRHMTGGLTSLRKENRALTRMNTILRNEKRRLTEGRKYTLWIDQFLLNTVSCHIPANEFEYASFLSFFLISMIVGKNVYISVSI